MESITTHDADWLAEDLDGIRLLEDHEASLCDGCGQPLVECLDPNTRRQYSARLIPCNACETKQMTLDDWAAEQRRGGFATPPTRVIVKPDWR